MCLDLSEIDCATACALSSRRIRVIALQALTLLPCQITRMPEGKSKMIQMHHANLANAWSSQPVAAG